jgi:hypothetical protein
MSLFDDASLVLTPNGVKSGKVYSIKPTDGVGDFDFTRASSATRVNSDGLIETVSTGVPRLNYPPLGGCPSLLLEPQSTNLYLNSETLVTQNITTTATSYTVSFYGTGTITFSGTYVGSLVGTGVNNRVSLTFTATAGTLTSTITGTCTKGQVEAGSYPTSYIPTVGGTVTRVVETCSGAGDVNTFNDSEGVLFAEISALANDGTVRRLSISDGSTANRIILEFNASSNTVRAFVVSANTIYYSASEVLSDTTNYNKVAIKYKQNDFALWINGFEFDVDNSGDTPINLSVMQFADGDNSGSRFYGNVKQIQYFDTALTDQELQQLTSL